MLPSGSAYDERPLAKGCNYSHETAALASVAEGLGMDDYTSAPLPADFTNAHRIYVLWNYTTCTVPHFTLPHMIS